MTDRHRSTPATRYRMPFALMCGMGLSALFAGVTGLVLLAFVVMIPFTHTFTVNDVPATRGEFLRFFLPLFAGFAAAATTTGAVAYGLWRERSWSRPVMMAFWGVAVLMAAGVAVFADGTMSESILALVELLVIAAVAYWYLYHRPGVVAYYAALDSRQLHNTPATSDSGVGGA